MRFNKRWQAEAYILWLKVKNRLKHGKMISESYGIQLELPARKYSVIELILTEKIQKEFDKAFDEEITKYINK
jgi:hypothetical protein